jgi:hypothetical protein
LLAKQGSATGAMHRVLFGLVIFGIESCLYAWVCLDGSYTSQVAEMTGTCHHAQFFEMGRGCLSELFA